MADKSFDRAQYNWDNMLPPDDDPPDPTEDQILQICQEWAEDPPDWLREKVGEYWDARWYKGRGR